MYMIKMGRMVMTMDGSFAQDKSRAVLFSTPEQIGSFLYTKNLIDVFVNHVEIVIMEVYV